MTKAIFFIEFRNLILFGSKVYKSKKKMMIELYDSGQIMKSLDLSREYRPRD
jgi:hypothetical protein